MGRLTATPAHLDRTFFSPLDYYTYGHVPSVIKKCGEHTQNYLWSVPYRLYGFIWISNYEFHSYFPWKFFFMKIKKLYKNMLSTSCIYMYVDKVERWRKLRIIVQCFLKIIAMYNIFFISEVFFCIIRQLLLKLCYLTNPQRSSLVEPFFTCREVGSNLKTESKYHSIYIRCFYDGF